MRLIIARHTIVPTTYQFVFETVLQLVKQIFKFKLHKEKPKSLFYYISLYKCVIIISKNKLFANLLYLPDVFPINYSAFYKTVLRISVGGKQNTNLALMKDR